MARKKFSAEQIVTMLRQVEVETAKGKSLAEACRQGGITEQTFYRWRKDYGGMRVNQAKWLKELEKENLRLKKVVADLTLDNQILKEVSKGNF